MSITGMSITKSVSFRGATQEFSNVYFWKTPLGHMDSGEAASAVSTIVAFEKTIHSSDVTFVRAKVWSTGGTKAENEMIYQTNLSGTGSKATATSLDRERAVLIRFRAGVDTRGRPVYLRKYFHICGAYLSGAAPAAGNLQNTTQITSGERTGYASAADGIKHITAGIRGFDLTSESGRDIDGSTITHAYLEHHQMGDMWR
jgi:hypothetical protein